MEYNIAKDLGSVLGELIFDFGVNEEGDAVGNQFVVIRLPRKMENDEIGSLGLHTTNLPTIPEKRSITIHELTRKTAKNWQKIDWDRWTLFRPTTLTVARHALLCCENAVAAVPTAALDAINALSRAWHHQPPTLIATAQKRALVAVFAPTCAFGSRDHCPHEGMDPNQLVPWAAISTATPGTVYAHTQFIPLATIDEVLTAEARALSPLAPWSHDPL